ncbi:MAG: carbamoyltransferase [Pirellulaceae bacterium]
MTAILGISAFYHDSAAALVVDGEIVAAAQEERFTRKKHDSDFPKHAIDYCLSEAGLTPDQISHVGFYEKPLLKFDRLLETYLSFAPLGYRSFLKAMPQWVGQKLHLRREIRRGLGGDYQRRICFCQHHESHAASAFFPSPFNEAAILSMDGVGEWATTSLGIGRGNRVQLQQEIRFPHSLGLLYSAFTYYSGFRVNSGEYKLMGLAPYGQPLYADAIRENLIQIRDDGSFRLNLEYFNYCQGLTMTGKRFHDLFGRSPRKPETPISQLDMDLAASIQAVTEEVVLKTATHLHQTTGMRNLCMAGGVALNCVANGRLVREGPFEQVWIQPAAGDAGGALGVAQLIWHQLLDNPRTAQPMLPDRQSASLLGPSFSRPKIQEILDSLGASYQCFDDEIELLETVADELATEKVVGRFQGRMEFGPRALGNRSILGDPRSEKMQSIMNLKIKFRESFRPFAPVVLADQATEYFQIPRNCESPYMLCVFDVADKHRVTPTSDSAAGLEKVRQIRSTIPAVTHVDYSARVQTVDRKRNPAFERLLRAFFDKTGCPILINTSFNVRGEPIVCTPADAYRCFMATNMDVLVVENFVLRKSDQPQATQHEIDSHLASFELD